MLLQLQLSMMLQIQLSKLSANAAVTVDAVINNAAVVFANDAAVAVYQSRCTRF